MKIMKAEYVGINSHDMSPSELMDAATYCNSWKNPYCEEMCCRTGNIESYRNNPVQAAKAAASGYGILMI